MAELLRDPEIEFLKACRALCWPFCKSDPKRPFFGIRKQHPFRDPKSEFPAPFYDIYDCEFTALAAFKAHRNGVLCISKLQSSIPAPFLDMRDCEFTTFAFLKAHRNKVLCISGAQNSIPAPFLDMRDCEFTALATLKNSCRTIAAQ